jgi:hypothetical protein
MMKSPMAYSMNVLKEFNEQNHGLPMLVKNILKWGTVGVLTYFCSTAVKGRSEFAHRLFNQSLTNIRSGLK